MRFDGVVVGGDVTGQRLVDLGEFDAAGDKIVPRAVAGQDGGDLSVDTVDAFVEAGDRRVRLGGPGSERGGLRDERVERGPARTIRDARDGRQRAGQGSGGITGDGRIVLGDVGERERLGEGLGSFGELERSGGPRRQLDRRVVRIPAATFDERGGLGLVLVAERFDGVAGLGDRVEAEDRREDRAAVTVAGAQQLIEPAL